MSSTKRPQRPEPFVASSTARRKVRGSMCRVSRVVSTWEARALMGLRNSGGKKLLMCISLETRRSKYRSSRGGGGGCRGRRAATVDHWAAVVNGTRAAGGGGGGIVLPAARGAGGAVEPVEAAGAKKVTEAAGRVVVRAGGGCWEPAPKVEVTRRWWRSAEAMSAAVERCCVMLRWRRPERSACSWVREAALACSGWRTLAYSSSAKEKAQASAAVRPGPSTGAVARTRSRLVFASWRVTEPSRVRRAGSIVSQTSFK